jgi:hypothetical protein
MPVVHSCPGCDRKCKVPDGFEGKKMKCPGCQAVLLVTEDGLEIAQKQAVQAAPAKPARKIEPPPDEEEEEEEKPGKPTKRKAIEEEDEDEEEERKPKKRKVVKDEDEEEEEEERKPKKRKVAKADDDDEEEAEEEKRPKKKKKRRRSSGGGIPGWVWIAGGGGVVVVAVVAILLLVLSGGSSNLSKVKQGMTEKEVIALVGPPHHLEFGLSIWSNPKMTRDEAMRPGSEKRVKEALAVQFVNGKAERVEYKTGSEIAKGR